MSENILTLKGKGKCETFPQFLEEKLGLSQSNEKTLSSKCIARFSPLCIIGKGNHAFFARTIMSFWYILNNDDICLKALEWRHLLLIFTAWNVGHQGWFYLRHWVCLPPCHKRLILVPPISAALTPFIEHISFIIAHTISICVRYIQTNRYVYLWVSSLS